MDASSSRTLLGWQRTGSSIADAARNQTIYGVSQNSLTARRCEKAESTALVSQFTVARNA